jgi:hypothetical protein
MRKSAYFGMAVAAFLILPQAVEAAKWRGQNGDLYDTLEDCFKRNYSCSVARLVKAPDLEALVAAAAAERSARAGKPGGTAYYTLAGPGRPPGAAAAISTTGCLTSKGTVHRPPCDKEKEKEIIVIDK